MMPRKPVPPKVVLVREGSNPPLSDYEPFPVRKSCMREVPRELIMRGIRDLFARQQNAGSWPDGLPESFKAIRAIKEWDEDGLWVLVVEVWLKERALGLVVELAEKAERLAEQVTELEGLRGRVDKLEMDIEALTDR